MKKIISLLTALLVLCCALPAALAAQSTFTVLVYLCGTDLESDGGAATADLREMIDAEITPDGPVTVYVQTGGTKKWQTDGLANKQAERWVLDQNGLTRVESLGAQNMGDEATLADFIASGVQRYPADRYGLILWDHGNGATGGVCYDEMTDDGLMLDELYGAMERGGARFAFVGFDACLMGSYETAMHLRPFADTLIASEELEPGQGWRYTRWLSALNSDPGIAMSALGQIIVDDFVGDIERGDYGTLSMLDLTRMDALSEAVESLGESLTGEIDAGSLTAISRARQNMRSFGELDDSASDMIDLTLLANTFARFNSGAAEQIKSALADAVMYERHTSNLSDVSGLSILVPYTTCGEAWTYIENYDAHGLSPSYTRFVTTLLNQMTEGSYTFSSTAVSQQSVQDAQINWFSQYASDVDSYYDASESYCEENDDFSLDGFLNSLFAEDDGSAFEQDDEPSASGGSSFFSGLWGDLDTESSTVDVQTQGGSVAVENPFANASGDYAYTVTLTQDELQYLAMAEANLMMDVSDPDFECYVELGYVQDVFVDWQGGTVYGLFDGTWPTLDGQMVCMYDQIVNDAYIRSAIPVTLNGVEGDLLVAFTEENPYGEVLGFSKGYSEQGVPARGYAKLSAGDVVVPQYKLLYWDENDEMQSEPFEGDPITVGADGTIEFGYDDVETDADYVYGFCLNNVFGDSQFTDFITLSF